MKNIRIFYLKIFFFFFCGVGGGGGGGGGGRAGWGGVEKFSIYLNRLVFLMNMIKQFTFLII